jgi:hypothetical protein
VAALGVAAAAGDPEAAETLLRVNHPLIRRIAHRYLARRLPPDPGQRIADSEQDH